ncbi:peptidoglycan-binding protein LysM [Gemmobacter denitrificans]|uniref:Peptidoglycan-binding protein LysM n=1 Tax=Gemmobacter denitrificans TaxID=3123040 RepID=A0ABU8BS01_9RHOB
MGLWSFVKDAGSSLFGSKAEAAEAPEDAAAREAALKAEVEKLGLEAGDVQIAVEGDKVKITGTAPTAEAQEKVILAVGNVAGVAAVEADMPQGAEPVFYTVKKGDTLSAIAKATLGNANRYPEIFEANKPMLQHPDKIYPGQNLRIPAK